MTRLADRGISVDLPQGWEGSIYQRESEIIKLCRCGQSSTKPFCDDTHLTNGFQSDVSSIMVLVGERVETPALS